MDTRDHIFSTEQQSNSVNSIDRLESSFFELLDRLRFNWKTKESMQLLIVIFFLKRFLKLKEESKISFFVEKEDLDYFSDLDFNYKSNPVESIARLRMLFINISRNNKDLEYLFAPVIYALEKEEDLKFIIEVLIEMNQLDFSTSFVSISDFGHFFNKMLGNLSIKNDLFYCNDFLSNLIVNSVEPKENNHVYIPFSGLGNLILALKTKSESLNITAFEKNPNLWAFSKMNLLMNGIQENMLFNSNPLTSTDQTNLSSGSAVGVFPFGMKLETRTVKNRAYIDIPFEVTHSELVNCDSLIIQNMIYHSDEKARISFLLPLTSLDNNTEDKKLREYLLKRDWLETIIALPTSITETDYSIALITINKDKNEENIGAVNFVNLQQGFENQVSEMELFSILTDFQNKLFDSEFFNFARIENDSLYQDQFNLNPKKHTAKYSYQLKKIISSGNSVSISEVLYQMRPLVWVDKSESVFDELPFLRVEDLSINFSDYQLNISRLKCFNQYNFTEAKLLKEDAILFYKDDNQLKISYFEYSGKSLLVHSDIHILNFDKNINRAEYLILQLYSDLILQQLNNFWDANSHIDLELIFSKIIIERPSLTVQDKYSKDKKLSLLQFEETKVENLRNTLNLDKRDAQSRQNKIISSIHHELGNKIPAVLNEFKNLRDFLLDKANSKEKISLDDSIYPFFENEIESERDKLSSVLRRLENNLVNAIESLESTGQIIRAERDKMQLESISLKVFLEDLTSLYQSEKNFNIVLDYSSSEDSFNNNFIIQADKAQLKTLFINLIDNAKKHGFTEGKKYTANFKLSRTSDNLIQIDYKNDGKEFHKDFSFDDFISYGYYAGKTGNSGIGGFLIHQIVENHKGTILKVENIDKNDPFKVHFRICFPLNLI